MAPRAAERPKLLPCCLSMPGVQHITNNMCNDVRRGLLSWSRFWQQAKAPETMLVISERRSRFIWTCLRGPCFSHKEPMFDSFTNTLCEARWKAVLEA